MQRISPKKYAVILHQVLAGLPDRDVTSAVQLFVKLVARHKDLSKADRIIRAFQKIADKQENITAVNVITAQAIEPHLLDTVQKDLEAVLNTQVRLSHSVDHAVIGGAIVKYGDTVVDGSVRKRIELLAKSLAQ